MGRNCVCVNQTWEKGVEKKKRKEKRERQNQKATLAVCEGVVE